ncbi:hypothetical protein-signal peptide prediction [hydrothermal vent metagenome]|uniref:Lipoprotein n=1 Tax=hydrothermal vent metagenome TaxID=652676 RepID=A0A3B1D097_9ZZZZ
MNKLHKPFLTFACLALVTSLLITGCGGDKKDTPPKGDEHGHAHPTKGPHGGSLIELGKEKYHAELVHDEKAKTVTIYLLDSEAKKAVPVDAKEMVINLTHGGENEKFVLAASSDEGETGGKSSRFVSKNEELVEDLDAKDMKATLSIKIEGKSFSGDIKHEHGHEGHDHGKKEHKHKEGEDDGDNHKKGDGHDHE